MTTRTHCPSNHWNDGYDICADCGADLNLPIKPTPQHTPGPWGLDDKTDSITWGDTAFGAPVGAGGFVVASHSVCKIPRHQAERLTDEHRANAHLIAAAPELLAAAEAMLAAFGGNTPDWLTDEAAQMFAAIAKAKGGAA